MCPGHSRFPNHVTPYYYCVVPRPMLIGETPLRGLFLVDESRSLYTSEPPQRQRVREKSSHSRRAGAGDPRKTRAVHPIESSPILWEGVLD